MIAVLVAAAFACGALLRARRATQRYELLARHTTDAVSRHAPDGTVTFISPNGHAVLGIEPADAAGTPLAALCHPDDRDAVRAAFARVVTGEDATVMFRAPDGTSWHPVEMTLERVSDARGRVAEVIATTRDITARVEAERVLRASQKLHRMVLDHLPTRSSPSTTRT